MKPATVVRILRARAGEMELNSKPLAKAKCKYSKIVIQAYSNDIWLLQSKVTKVSVESMCSCAKTMSDSVVFSGPLPESASDKMFSR